ncbi:hypothetical protein HK101_003141 [Irineochytrium annulatum]|nr:hypothetical protein HK101_003141 [Irineochytrium annulatum]
MPDIDTVDDCPATGNRFLVAVEPAPSEGKVQMETIADGEQVSSRPSKRVSDCSQPSPEETAPWYLFPTQSWLTPFMRTAVRRPLQTTDLFRLHPKFQAGTTAKKMRERVARGMRDAGFEDVDGPTRTPAGMSPEDAKLRRHRRMRAIKWSLFWDGILSWPRESFVALILHAASSLGNIVSPIILNYLLNYLTNPSTHGRAFGYGLCVALFVAQLFVAFGWNNSQYITRNVAMSVKASVISNVFRKSMTISTRARGAYNNGRTLNLVASDASNLESFYTYMYDCILLPIEVVGLSVLIIVYLGPAGAAGLAFMVLCIALQSFAMSKVMKYERKALQATDERVNLTSEVLGGIRVIKYFAWEPFFGDRINKLRDRELGHIFVLRLILSTFLGVINILPASVSFITFSVYWALGNSLDPATVFTALSIIQLIRLPVAIAPLVAQMAWSALVSIERIAKFLAVDDNDSPPDVYTRDDPLFNGDDIVVERATFVWEEGTAEEFDVADEDDATVDKKKKKTAAATEDASATDKVEGASKGLAKSGSADTLVEGSSVVVEEEAGPIMHLREIDFKAARGSLTVVVGKVGAGKSSLLHAIIGDMKRAEGKVSVFGSIAFASQTPWLQNATLRANVLFGQPYEPARYAAVIRACALERDLTLLSRGDESEIGEKGVTLSGGQAARVNLARAVYARSDILLLDDPLSAVDAHVGRTLMEECVLGLCKGRTVVLVTHQVQVATKADRVLLVDKGRIVEDGTYAELTARSGGAFAALMRDHGGAKAEEAGQATKEEKQGTVEKVEEKVAAEGTGALMTTEERELGAVRGEYYAAFFKMSGGYGVVAAVVLTCMIWQSERIVTDLWLTFWVSRQFNGWSDSGYIAGLGVLSVAQFALVITVTLTVTLACLRGSRAMHSKVLASILRAPMSFFDTTPIGRIISRFSRDFSETDRMLPRGFQSVMEIILGICGTLALILYAVPWVGFLIVILVPMYAVFLKIFRSSMRELKRLESNLRSPLYSYINEMLTGISTVRAYGAEGRFIETQEHLQNKANRPTYIKNTVDSWMSIRAETSVAFLILIMSIVGLSTKYVNIHLVILQVANLTPFSVNTSLLGLALSYALTLTALLNILLRNMADLESRMNCVERITHYTRIAQEAPTEATAANGLVKPSASWPENGEVNFTNVTLRYRPELEPVLHGLTFNIRAGEKVGVIGRTGAGKSSIIAAIFRMVEPSGTITIDGVDVSKIGLSDLRTKVAIIPQTPILFEGTLRSNLDPLGRHDDATIWAVLRRCSLGDAVTRLAHKLEAPVSESGENFSVGERQLLCLGRAMLARCKVLLIDEATASVDRETDNYIQKVLREDFEGQTIICIAHRLLTLVDYDRVLVLDHGRIVEFDAPHVLLSNPDSAMSALVANTGSADAALIRKLAAESFNARKGAVTEQPSGSLSPSLGPQVNAVLSSASDQNMS